MTPAEHKAAAAKARKELRKHDAKKPSTFYAGTLKLTKRYVGWSFLRDLLILEVNHHESFGRTSDDRCPTFAERMRL